MNEDYVSFETAKLLKEKGFDWECKRMFRAFKNSVPKVFDTQWITNGDLCDLYQNCEFATIPTLQMAMKWIRKKYNAYPVPYALSLGWAFDIFDLTKTDITGSKKIYSMDAPLKSDCFDSYENAAEAAINYYLDNFA